MSVPLIRPHGGTLVDQLVSDRELDGLQDRAKLLPQIRLDARELADLEMLATGALSPLRGFMSSADYASVRDRMRLANGLVWPLPITLAVSEEVRSTLRAGSETALFSSSGRLWAVLRIEEIFQRDPMQEARAVYKTDSANHPGVSYLLSRPRWLVGGEVRALPFPEDLPFAQHRLSPRQVRQIIATRGWRSVAGFQTRNPIHRAHEHLTKVALEVTDGLLVHPLVGETKGDDVPASVRFRVYQALLDKYYPKERTVLAAFPAAMRYAGPREAIFHALVRKNYGVTHLIVGRDHAGVGDFYGPFDAQRVFDEFQLEDIGVVPLKFEAAFFCTLCGSLASAKTCPHDPSHRLEFSGSRVRQILRDGGDLPEQFTRREVAELLRAHYGSFNGHGVAATNGHAPPKNGHDAAAVSALGGARQNGIETSARTSATAPRGASARWHPTRGFVLWLTGLSGAGKSTLAAALQSRFARSVPLELLDGDEVRTYLSKELGFSKEDRDANVRRIGYVARLLARNGVIAIAAAISPYRQARGEVRDLATKDGVPFVEVHVHAPLDALVKRDVKGLYRRALAGELAHFTGISDPYEAPADPDALVRSDLETVEESVEKILSALRARRLVGEERPAAETRF